MRWSFLPILLVGLASPLAAQGPAEITLEAGAAYRHEPTGLTVPPTLAELPRLRAMRYVHQLDEAVEFADEGQHEDITVFVFRHVTGSIPLWFDRAAQQIIIRPVYGAPTPLSPPTAFAPPGQATASALLQVFQTGKPPYRSTGLALLPLGDDWFVKLRYSSASIAPEALGAKMQSVLAALDWPKTIALSPVATAIADCTTSLDARANAKPLENSLGSSLLQSALLGAMAKQETPPATKQVATFCRDPAPRPALANAGIYRPGGARDSYLLAFADAGRGVFVAPDTLGALLGERKGKSFSVTLHNMAQSFVFAPRDRLPPPEQTAEIVKSERPVSSRMTWGGNHDIAIDAKAVR